MTRSFIKFLIKEKISVTFNLLTEAKKLIQMIKRFWI